MAAVKKKSPFVKTYEALANFIETKRTIPVLMFSNDEGVTEVLRGRQFMFNTAEGKNAKKQTLVAIQVVEVKDGKQEPLLTAHSIKDKKDMRMTVMFHGEAKLPDGIVDHLIVGVQLYIDDYDKNPVTKH